jgi:hypothetical protein
MSSNASIVQAVNSMSVKCLRNRRSFIPAWVLIRHPRYEYAEILAGCYIILLAMNSPIAQIAQKNKKCIIGQITEDSQLIDSTSTD